MPHTASVRRALLRNPDADRPERVTPTISTVDDRRDVLGALADLTCRSVLRSTSDRELTANEVAEVIGNPLSTAYRKLDQLVDTPLLDATYRLEADGNHARDGCPVERIQIRFAERDDRVLNIPLP